jgi:hypothetical protein
MPSSLNNSAYSYRRTGKMDYRDDEPRPELAEIRRAL